MPGKPGNWSAKLDSTDLHSANSEHKEQMRKCVIVREDLERVSGIMLFKGSVPFLSEAGTIGMKKNKQKSRDDDIPPPSGLSDIDQ